MAVEVAGAVAVAEVGAEGEHFQAAENAADVVAANDLGAAHSAAVGHLGVEDSAAVAAAAAVAQEEKWAAEDMIDRLAEAQSTAVDPAVGHSHLSLVVEGKSYHLVVDFRILTWCVTEACLACSELLSGQPARGKSLY